MESPTHTPRWLVTGASGFLGANFGYFLRTHADATAVTRLGSIPTPYATAVPGELDRPEELARRIKDDGPDVVVHVAAMASHEACERNPEAAAHINADATGVLARAAHGVGARFVYISTDAVFDGRVGHYSEEDLPNPTSVYGKTKVQGEEQACRAADALIIRTNFFGWSPSGHRSILEFFVNELSAGHQVRGFTDFTTTSAYAQVLAKAIYDLVLTDATGVFHVTSPDALTKYQFGHAVAEEFGLDARLITPTQADIRPPRAGDISLDVSKVQRALRRSLPTQREGLALAHKDADTLRQVLRSNPTP